MQARASLRRALPALVRARAAPHANACAPLASTPTRHFASNDETSPKNTILYRLLAPNESGRNPILSALGYYSAESRAIGAGNSLYKQVLARSTAVALAEADNAFSPRFEILSVHVYLTLRRLRMEKGSAQEAEIKTIMQCLFDNFWQDVRVRMMMKEEGLKLIASGRWIKECERMFFGLALSFDEAWEDVKKLDTAIGRNISCLQNSSKRIVAFRRYMVREKDRLDKMPIQEIWDGTYWDDRYSSPKPQST